jgi:hypothetical protein
LIELCRRVVKSKSPKVAERLLPSQSGFFFGGTQYDESYFGDLKDTVKMLAPIIRELKADEINGISSYCEYGSSW